MVMAMIDESVGPEVLKQHNRELVMSIIEQRQPISRAVLARQAHLSRTAVSQLVSELLQVGLIHETGESILTGGRPGLLLELSADSWHAIGVELRDDEWVLVITNLAGKICDQVVIQADYTSVEITFRALGRSLVKIVKKTPYRLLPAIGVGVPGLVDEDAGIVIRSEDRGWVDVPVRKLLADELDMRFLVINRHNAGGLGESRYGAGVGLSHVIYVGVDTGVVAAILIDGRLYKGPAYGAGQIGHTTIAPDGPLCTCGNRGCLELMASGKALAKMVSDRIQGGERSLLSAAECNDAHVTVDGICAAAQKGDALAIDCLQKTADYLGIAIANLINIINPNGVVIGGSTLQHNDLLFNMIKTVIEQRTLKYHLGKTILRPSFFRHNAGSVGAAALVLEYKLDLLFNQPHAFHIQRK